jgi:hypothetical protein
LLLPACCCCCCSFLSTYRRDNTRFYKLMLNHGSNLYFKSFGLFCKGSAAVQGLSHVSRCRRARPSRPKAKQKRNVRCRSRIA